VGFKPAGLRVGFIECNKHDATKLSHDLQRALGHPVEPLLLDEVIADPRAYVGIFDILAVNLTHIAALETATKSAVGEGRPTRILGMHIPIDLDSLMQVTRLPPNTKVGVVCDLKRTLLSMTGLIRGCNPNVHVDGSLTNEPENLQRLLKRSEVLLVTPSALPRVDVSKVQVPVITPSFRIDARSIEQLSEFVSQRGR
jgi:hypothetical protein